MNAAAGVDTNVLLRLLLEDDPHQLARVHAFVEERSGFSPLMINSVVLAEVFWTVRSSLKLPREQIAARLAVLFDTPFVALIDEAAARAALADYRNGLGDFSDRLIARINEAHGASHTFTFDRKAARHPPLALVP
jgi:predicted nucleic-acid-binding protein